MLKNSQLKKLKDDFGIYRILALDHFSTLKSHLHEITGKETITDEELIEIKKVVIEVLKNDITGILLDPSSFIATEKDIPNNVGILIKLENGWENGTKKRERITQINTDWSVNKIGETSACGIKLMLYYRPDTSLETIKAQQKLVLEIGQECKKNNLVFCLEPMWYPLRDDEIGITEESSLNLARRRPQIVIDSLRDFIAPEYNVDLFKLEFPADLKYVKEFSNPKSPKQSLYSLKEVENFCSEMGKLTQAPWTVMSSGVSNSDFIKYIEICKLGNVNGYICGQAIWKDALLAYPNLNEVKHSLLQNGLPNISKINDSFKKEISN